MKKILSSLLLLFSAFAAHAEGADTILGGLPAFFTMLGVIAVLASALVIWIIIRIFSKKPASQPKSKLDYKKEQLLDDEVM